MGKSAEPVVAAELLHLATRTARAAGELVASMRAVGVDVAATKSSVVDIVTAADRAAETLIKDRLLAARPGDGLLGEEGSDLTGTSGVRWIVDPIDGTVNYLYGLPNYAVSIGAEVDGTVVAGVVLAPALGEEYAATLGGAATCNGSRLRVRDWPPAGQALVLTGFNYDRDVRARQGAAAARMLPHVRDLRRLGSCAVDLCLVAAGRADAYVEEGVNEWDHAAGGLIAAEAGARVATYPGASGLTLLACAPEAGYQEFIELVVSCGFLREQGELPVR